MELRTGLSALLHLDQECSPRPIASSSSSGGAGSSEKTLSVDPVGFFSFGPFQTKVLILRLNNAKCKVRPDGTNPIQRLKPKRREFIRNSFDRSHNVI